MAILSVVTYAEATVTKGVGLSVGLSVVTYAEATVTKGVSVVTYAEATVTKGLSVGLSVGVGVILRQGYG